MVVIIIRLADNEEEDNQDETTVKCGFCSSEEVEKNGHKNGCLTCNTIHLDPNKIDIDNTLDKKIIAAVIQAYSNNKDEAEYISQTAQICWNWPIWNIQIMERCGLEMIK